MEADFNQRGKNVPTANRYAIHKFFPLPNITFKKHIKFEIVYR